MNTKPAALVSLMFLSIAACVEPQLGEDLNEIVNGQVDGGHEAVVEVAFMNGAFACTGTIIGDVTVITAAHCAFPNGVFQNQLQVRVPLRACPGCAPTMTWVAAAPIVNPTYVPGPTSAGADVALLHLAQPVMWSARSSVPGLAKILVFIDGMPITLVGFGEQVLNQGGFTVKRWGSNFVDTHDDTYFYFDYDGPASGEATTCRGDSGGPAYTGGYNATCILGVTKGVTPGSTACGVNATYRHSRLDRIEIASWILSNAMDGTISTCIPYH